MNSDRLVSDLLEFVYEYLTDNLRSGTYGTLITRGNEVLCGIGNESGENVNFRYFYPREYNVGSSEVLEEGICRTLESLSLSRTGKIGVNTPEVR